MSNPGTSQGGLILGARVPGWVRDAPPGLTHDNRVGVGLRSWCLVAVAFEEALISIFSRQLPLEGTRPIFLVLGFTEMEARVTALKAAADRSKAGMAALKAAEAAAALAARRPPEQQHGI